MMNRYGVYADRIASQNPRTYHLHSHDYHELYFLISGERRYFISHCIYDVSPGNLVIVPHTELHKTTSIGAAGYDRYALFVYESNLQPFIDVLGRSIFDALMHCGCLQLPQKAVRQIQQDLEQLVQACRVDSPIGQAYVNHLVQDILLCALRWGKEKRTSQGEGAKKIQDIARYISQNYDTALTLRDAARMVYMEHTYFSKRFKQLTGFGFQEYLTQTRLRAAEQLLKTTTLSLGEIAERCGFSSSNYFGDAFRRWKGISPSAYRKKADSHAGLMPSPE